MQPGKRALRLSMNARSPSEVTPVETPITSSA